MLSPQLRRKVHDLWSLFWSSGLSNPLVAIEQITYLLFIRQLEKLDGERVKQGKVSIYGESLKLTGASNLGTTHANLGPHSLLAEFEHCKWSYIRQNVSFPLLNDTVFPWLRTLERRVGPAQNGNTTLGRISGRLSDAYFILDTNKTETLKRAVSLIDDLFRQLDTRSVNSDIMGDIFEYLLEEVKESGKNGQFRTPAAPAASSSTASSTGRPSTPTRTTSPSNGTAPRTKSCPSGPAASSRNLKCSSTATTTTAPWSASPG